MRASNVWQKSVEKNLVKVKEQIRKETGKTTPAALQAHLEAMAEGICFVHGSGRRKSEEQRQWERLSGLLERWKTYEEQLGEGRNSYAKTDPDAALGKL